MSAPLVRKDNSKLEEILRRFPGLERVPILGKRIFTREQVLESGSSIKLGISQGEISNQTFGAIIKYVAVSNPNLLNVIFEGIQLPDYAVEAVKNRGFEIPNRISMHIENEHARDCIAYYVGSPNGWGSLEDERRIFHNLINHRNDALTPFEVGFNSKSAFSTIKLMFLLASSHPNTAFRKGAPAVNRRMNGVFDLRHIEGSKNYSVLEIEYFPQIKPHINGDLYTLGVLVAGIDSLEREGIKVTQLISPFDESTEQVKLGLNQRGIEFSLEDCRFEPGTQVHTYRFDWKEESRSFWKRLELVFRELDERKKFSRLGVQEYETAAETIAQQQDSLEYVERKAYEETVARLKAETEAAEARAEKERIRADAEEAKRGLDAQTSTVNDLVDRVNLIAHDDAHLAEDSKDDLINYLTRLRKELEEGKIKQQEFDIANNLIGRVIERQQRLMNNERSIMGLGAGDTEFYLDEILDHLVETVRVAYPNLDITYDKGSYRKKTKGDKEILGAAIANIIKNAAEASQPKNADKGKLYVYDGEEQYGDQRTFAVIGCYQTGSAPAEILERLSRGQKIEKEQRAVDTKKTSYGKGSITSHRIFTRS